MLTSARGSRRQRSYRVKPNDDYTQPTRSYLHANTLCCVRMRVCGDPAALAGASGLSHPPRRRNAELEFEPTPHYIEARAFLPKVAS